MNNNYMNLKIKAISCNVEFARSVVGAFCAQLNPTLDEISDIKTAVSEAVTNCIVHAYVYKDGIIEIEATIEDNRIHIEIKDTGVGISDIEQARRPFFTTKPDEERSGMGFTVMESFMDMLEVLPNEPTGTIVKMSKNFDVNSSGANQT